MAISSRVSIQQSVLHRLDHTPPYWFSVRVIHISSQIPCLLCIHTHIYVHLYHLPLTDWMHTIVQSQNTIYFNMQYANFLTIHMQVNMYQHCLPYIHHFFFFSDTDSAEINRISCNVVLFLKKKIRQIENKSINRVECFI